MRTRSIVAIGVLSLLLLTTCAADASGRAKFRSDGRSITYEIFGNPKGQPVLILLPGASGPESALYRTEAQLFSAKGYTVFILHYFDATPSSVPSTANYAAWVKAVETLVDEIQRNNHILNKKIALVGFSLGSSVALAAGSQSVPVDAVVDWYGSLPDDYFNHLLGMPPLLILHGARDNVIPVINAEQLVRLCGLKQLTCENNIYDDQGHGFTGKALEDANSKTLEFLSRILK
jgi:dienelactone hydrolase